MKFFFEVDNEETREYQEQFADVTFACTRCASEDTVETNDLVPSGVHYKVLCENGHITNGMPPARFRNLGI